VTNRCQGRKDVAFIQNNKIPSTECISLKVSIKLLSEQVKPFLYSYIRNMNFRIQFKKREMENVPSDKWYHENSS
jgi:hypothetical protein